MLLYVIVAAYDAPDHLPRLIESLSHVFSSKCIIHLVVVDNGKNKSIPRGLAAALDAGAATYIANERNVGVSAAWNTGIRLAIENAADAILIAGHDTCPQPGAIEAMLDHLASGILFVTGTAVRPGYVYNFNLPPSTTMLAAPDFSFFMFQPSVVQIVGVFDGNMDIKLRESAKSAGSDALPVTAMKPWDWGMFDSRYWPAYFEDNDFHYRCHMAGVLCLRDPSIVFQHDCSLAMRVDPELAAEIQHRRFQKNANLFREKWGKWPHEVAISRARPLNCTDEEWRGMTGGHEVEEIDAAQAVESARAVYARYGMKA